AFRRALREEARPLRTVRSNLRPIVDTWPLVRDILKVTAFQAITFVEEAFDELGLVLYWDDETTGLYIPKSGDVHTLLSDLGTSTYAHNFANGKEELS